MPGKSRKAKPQSPSKGKGKEINPIFHKGSNLRKGLSAAATFLGGPSVWVYKGIQNIKKKRKESGMDYKKGGLIQHD